MGRSVVRAEHDLAQLVIAARFATAVADPGHAAGAAARRLENRHRRIDGGRIASLRCLPPGPRRPHPYLPLSFLFARPQPVIAIHAGHRVIHLERAHRLQAQNCLSLLVANIQRAVDGGRSAQPLAVCPESGAGEQLEFGFQIQACRRRPVPRPLRPLRQHQQVLHAARPAEQLFGQRRIAPTVRIMKRVATVERLGRRLRFWQRLRQTPAACVQCFRPPVDGGVLHAGRKPGPP